MQVYAVMHSHEPKTTILQPCQMCVLRLDSLLPPEDGLLLGSMGKSVVEVKFHRNGDSLLSPGPVLLSVLNKTDGTLYEISENLESGGWRHELPSD
jgi:hypothetical protein